MRVHLWTRDRVDRTLRGPNYRTLTLPAFLPMLAAMLLDSPVPLSIGWVWLVAWSGFVAWRWWTLIKIESKRADRAYDRDGKFKLSREYWDTESATAAKAKKRTSK